MQLIRNWDPSVKLQWEWGKGSERAQDNVEDTGRNTQGREKKEIERKSRSRSTRDGLVPDDRRGGEKNREQSEVRIEKMNGAE
jgi:hypothetical protein